MIDGSDVTIEHMSGGFIQNMVVFIIKQTKFDYSHHVTIRAICRTCPMG